MAEQLNPQTISHEAWKKYFGEDVTTPQGRQAVLKKLMEKKASADVIRMVQAQFNAMDQYDQNLASLLGSGLLGGRYTARP